MDLPRGWFKLAVLVIGLFVCHQARAASLSGKVIEVNDGDEITVFNLNRSVRIKLVAIDAPEKDQEFGAAARQHLFDLVFGKMVTVEYSAIGQHSDLIGRVLQNGNDICAQMIRDGAAWFVAADQNLISETDREIYSASEQAARNEKRGLWQTGNAIAPWEYVKAQYEKRNPVASLPAVAAPQAKPDRATPDLDSMNLLRTGSAVAQPLSTLGSNSWADGTIARTWHRFQPAGENFSAVVPEGGEQVEKSIPFGTQAIPVKYYVIREGDSIYQLFWMKGPFLGETDDVALKSSFGGFVGGVNATLEKAGGSLKCESSSQHNISIGGYTGREYDLSQCPLPSRMRLFTKVVGNERQVYGGIVLFKEEDDNVSRFLKSFTVLSRKSELPKTKSTN